MAYLLSNICTKNYWNRTTIEISLVVRWYPFLRHSVECRAVTLRRRKTRCKTRIETNDVTVVAEYGDRDHSDKVA